MATTFLQISNCTVDSNVAALVGNKTGVVCTDHVISLFQVVDIEISKKSPAFLDHLPATSSLEIGFSSQSPDVLISDLSNILHRQDMCQNSSRKFKDLSEGQVLSFMLCDGSVCIFIDEVLMDKKRLPSSLPVSSLWAVVLFSGVFAELKFRFSRSRDRRYLCSKSIYLHPLNTLVKSGSVVKVVVLWARDKHCRLPEGNIWVKVVNDDIEGWMTTEFLEKVPKDLRSKSFDHALNDGHILCSITRIICVGSPGVGKTHLKQLLLKKDIPVRRNSTPIVATPSVSQIVNDEWVHIDSDTVVSLIAETATSQQSAKTSHSSYHDAKAFFKGARSQSLPESKASHPVPSPTSSLPVPISTHRDRSASTASVQSVSDRLQNVIALRSSSGSDADDSTTKQFIYFYDSGGQHQFLDLLPIFISGGVVVLIVIDISIDLDQKPPFSFYEDDKDLSRVSVMPQSSIEIIESVARTVSSYAHSCKGNKPFFSVVGTHYDNIKSRKERRIKEIDDKLREILHDVQELRIDFNERKGRIIFPIDALKDSENMAGVIRSKIQQKGLALELKIPCSWYVFELSLTEYTEKCNRQIVTLQECIEIGNSMDLVLDRDEIENLLKYFHFSNKYIYYPQYLENIVITEPQIVLQMLTSLLKITFCDSKLPLPAGAVTSLKEKGIFTKDVFDICLEENSSNFLPEFQPSHLRKLLVDLLVICNLDEHDAEYFIPSALSMCSALNTSEFLVNFNALCLLPRNGILLHGIFTALVVYLLKEGLFDLPKERLQYRDAVTLSYKPGGGCILLVDKFRWLEVYYSGASKKHAFKIKQLVMKGLKAILRVLPYSIEDVTFDYGFLCNMCDNNSPHPAKVNELDPFTTTCTKDSLKNRIETMETAARKLPWLFSLDTCSKPELPDFLNHVARKLGDKMWMEFGAHMKLPTLTLDNIDARDKGEMNGRYIAIFDEWGKSCCSEFSWKTVLSALESLGQQQIHNNLLKWLTSNFDFKSC